MRIGVVTILKVNNYGAELQAYATQAALNRLGYDAEIIDYLFYKNPGHKATALSRPVFRFGWKKKAAEWLYPKWEKVKAWKNRGSRERRMERFERFHGENTRMSRTYRTLDELYSDVPVYDIYMAGSDQVWNPGIYSSLEPYLLTFAPEGRRRVAYASSFGVSELPERCIPFYAERLRRMDAIGVREEQAARLVEDISGVKAEWVLDPTLLLDADDWRKVSREADAPPGGYLLLYEVTPCPYLKELALHLSGLSGGMPIVRICRRPVKEDRGKGIMDVADAGPAEFLRLFDGASAVVTNSFHGTAFSINFEKEFYSVVPARKENNSRQQSLLKLLGLEGRLLKAGAPPPGRGAPAVDYAAVRARLAEERGRSIQFINRAIHG